MDNSVLSFANDYGIFTTDVSLDENGGYEPLDDILGIRYIYSVSEPFLPGSGYKSVDAAQDVEVYRNENALSPGYAVKSDIESVETDDYEILSNVNTLTSAMSGSGDILEEYIPEYSISGEGFTYQTAETDYFHIRLIPSEASEHPYVRR